MVKKMTFSNIINMNDNKLFIFDASIKFDDKLDLY